MDSMPESLMQLATEIVETPVVETTTTGVETPVLETVESVVAEVETATVKDHTGKARQYAFDVVVVTK